MKLGHVGMMLHVGPSFVLYALLLDPGCCPRAHFELDGQFESEKTRASILFRCFSPSPRVPNDCLATKSKHILPRSLSVQYPVCCNMLVQICVNLGNASILGLGMKSNPICDTKPRLLSTR